MSLSDCCKAVMREREGERERTKKSCPVTIRSAREREEGEKGIGREREKERKTVCLCGRVSGHGGKVGCGEEEREEEKVFQCCTKREISPFSPLFWRRMSEKLLTNTLSNHRVNYTSVDGRDIRKGAVERAEKESVCAIRESVEIQRAGNKKTAALSSFLSPFFAFRPVFFCKSCNTTDTTREKNMGADSAKNV